MISTCINNGSVCGTRKLLHVVASKHDQRNSKFNIWNHEEQKSFNKFFKVEQDFLKKNKKLRDIRATVSTHIYFWPMFNSNII